MRYIIILILAVSFLLYAGVNYIYEGFISKAPSGIGASMSSVDSSAMFEVESTTGGFLAPRMTTVQKNNISTPATGLMVYDSDLGSYQFYTGSEWTSLGGGLGADGETVMAVNYFSNNSGFEESSFNQWNNTGATASVQSTTVAEGTYSAQWDATATSQTLISDAWTIPELLKENNAVFCFAWNGGDENIDVKLKEGANVLIEDTLATSSNWTTRCYNFIMPDASSLTFNIESTADAAVVYLDSFSVGLASKINIANYSTATLYGSLTWTGVTNCSWQNTTTGSWQSYGADSDCNVPVIEGSGSAPATKIPAITISNGQPGYYVFVATGYFLSGGSSADNVETVWRFSDGTNTTNPTYNRLEHEGAATTPRTTLGTLTGYIKYTDTVNETIEVQSYIGAGTNADINVEVAGTRDFQITVFRYPLESELAYTGNETGIMWSGYHDASCFWQRNSATPSGFTPDATCTFGTRLNKNFGTVSSTGSKTPGITFTPKKIGTYMLCSTFAASANTSGVAYDIILRNVTESSNLSTMGSYSVATSSRLPTTLCGLLDITNLNSVSIELYGASASILTVASHTGNSTSVEWLIYPVGIGHNIQILNQVSTPLAGGVKMCTFYITNSGTPSITQDDGCVDNLVDNGVGITQVNFDSNYWTTAPNCYCTCPNGSSAVCSYSNTPTTTTINSVYTRSTTGGGALGDTNFSIVCIGEK